VLGEYDVLADFLLESVEGFSSLFSFLLPFKALGVSMSGLVFLKYDNLATLLETCGGLENSRRNIGTR